MKADTHTNTGAGVRTCKCGVSWGYSALCVRCVDSAFPYIYISFLFIYFGARKNLHGQEGQTVRP